VEERVGVRERHLLPGGDREQRRLEVPVALDDLGHHAARRRLAEAGQVDDHPGGVGARLAVDGDGDVALDAAVRQLRGRRGAEDEDEHGEHGAPHG
jgi:hypothetical protein